jgi:hypothetical protein
MVAPVAAAVIVPGILALTIIAIIAMFAVAVLLLSLALPTPLTVTVARSSPTIDQTTREPEQRSDRTACGDSTE